MGKLYFDMGFLSTDDVVECSASDLIGRYVGQTGPKTKAQLDDARGKVLFIDEAYRLADGEYATEAVNELSHLLRSPKYSGNMIVILAGYEADMNRLMTIRPGLSGLFPEEIVFERIKPKHCLELLVRELSLKKIDASILQDTSSENYSKIVRLVRALSVFPSWSNARDIKTLARQMSAVTFTKFKDKPGDLALTFEVARDCTEKMIAMQIDRCAGQGGHADGFLESGQAPTNRYAKAFGRMNEMEIMTAAEAAKAPYQCTRRETNVTLPPSRTSTFRNLPAPAGPSRPPAPPPQPSLSGAGVSESRADQKTQVPGERATTKNPEERRQGRFRERARNLLSSPKWMKGKNEQAKQKKTVDKGKGKPQEDRRSPPTPSAKKASSIKRTKEKPQEEERLKGKEEQTKEKEGTCEGGYGWVPNGTGFICSRGVCHKD